jgi:hypothetical protein
MTAAKMDVLVSGTLSARRKWRYGTKRDPAESKVGRASSRDAPSSFAAADTAVARRVDAVTGASVTRHILKCPFSSLVPVTTSSAKKQSLDLARSSLHCQITPGKLVTH